MAIEYTLYIDTECALPRLRESVCACIRDESDMSPTGTLTFSGEKLLGTVSAVNEVTRQFVSEDFSFNARARVTFRLDKFALADSQDSLVRCVAAVLAADPSDAILLFNGETVVLRRRGSDLVLREGFGPWTSARLQPLGRSYRIGPIE
ncbi:SitI3 family protein [Enhygromyxa salina]|uniref:Uncharacterized protein n=1 Tax=Enhygromyxa salina TaxID=215803 RepID=A0A2S9YBZ3_9BACT|nr:hypothetical protein ENSA7_54630 [Enhygromyxa salina]